METQLNQQNTENHLQNQQQNQITEQLRRECEQKQIDLASQIDLRHLDISTIRYVAGCDAIYSEDENGIVHGFCAIVIIDLKDGMRITKMYMHEDFVDFPYIHGLMAFRELPLILKTAEKIRPEHKPDLYLFDGNGLLHERKMGLATHAAILLNTPSIGVAKKYYKFNNVEFVMPKDKQGSVTPIWHDGEVRAVAMRTKEGASPIFISCGNYITLDECQVMITRLVNAERSKNPVPLRLADIRTKKMLNKFMKANQKNKE